MIEDLDIAILWLNRVHIHFIREQSTTVDLEKKLPDGPHRPARSESIRQIFDSSYTPGKSEGVSIWRKMDGNLVVDIEVSDREEATV